MSDGGSLAISRITAHVRTGLARNPPRAADVLIAVSVAVYAIALFSADGRHRGSDAYLLVALVCVLLVGRRSAPEAALVIVAAVRWWQHVHGGPEAYVTVALFVCVFTIAALRPLPTALMATFASTVFVLLTSSPVNWHEPAIVGSVLGYLVTAAGCGLSVKRQRGRGDTLHQEVVGLERTASVREAAAIDEERSRLRDDLHDVVGHHLNLALVLTQKAQLAVSRDDPDSYQTLQSIEMTTRSALEEMDRATRWIHARAELSPTPALASYETLLRPLTDAGIKVTVSAPPRSDLEQIDLVASATAQRALQEALTNVMKHSADRWANVEIAVTDSLLQLSVLSGRARGHTDSTRLGTGLTAMRRRVELLGGALETVADYGSFAQRITIPWSTRTSR